MSVCNICLQITPPGHKVGKTAKVDHWVSCDCCKGWIHSSCGGYTVAQYNKIKKEKLWIKCIICCLQQIQSVERENDSNDTNALVQAAVTRRIQEVTSKKKGKQKKSIQFTPSSSNSISTPLSANTQINSNSILSPEPNQSHPSPAAKAQSTKESNRLSVIHNSTHSAPESSQADKVLIVDSVNNPNEFCSSKRILNEVNRYFPEIKVQFAYSLAKGGIAIHTSNQSDRDFLLHNLPAESFGNGIKHLPRNNSITTVFIKGVDTAVDVSWISDYLSREGIKVSEVRRLCKRYTGKPTQVVKVKCHSQSAESLMNIELVAKNKRCIIEKERTVQVVRCYNCQSLGHQARVCPNERRCEYCANCHSKESSECSRSPKCVNCQGDHPSYSSHCKAYLLRYENLSKQHSKP